MKRRNGEGQESGWDAQEGSGGGGVRGRGEMYSIFLGRVAVTEQREGEGGQRYGYGQRFDVLV